MAKGKKKSVDVRSKKDIAEFEKVLAVGPITLVLIYADWCGHCQHFKKDIWSDLQNLPNKKVNLASVHYDQLANTSQRDAKFSGYPSLLVIGNDKKPASFTENGQVTNALPDSRNKEMLETMVTAEPDKLIKTLESNNVNMTENVNVNNVPTNTLPNNNVSLNTLPTNNVRTLNFKPETLEKRNEANNMLLPPNTTEDRILNENVNMTNEGKPAEAQKGGSLLQTLMKIAQQTAPAAALLGAAAYRSKCKSRKTKKSKKRMTRRR